MHCTGSHQQGNNKLDMQPLLVTNARTNHQHNKRQTTENIHAALDTVWLNSSNLLENA